MDPIRSTGWHDSLLNEKKMWVDFRVLENPSPMRNGSPVESLIYGPYPIHGPARLAFK